MQKKEATTKHPDYGEVVRLLSSYAPSADEYNALIDEYRSLRSRLYQRGTNPDEGKTIFSESSGTGTIVCRVKLLEARLAEIIAANVRLRLEIEGLIERLQDRQTAAILRYRYINRVAMEFIPPKVHYSLRQCWRLHNRGINEIAAIWHAKA